MGRAEIRRKFDAIVEFAEVEKFLDTPVKHYSSGMYLRLAFSVAAHLDGEILLVDEVLAVGDVAFQKKCLGKMQDISRGGRTVVFISHNMAAVSALCTRAMVIDAGQTVFDAPAGRSRSLYLEHNLADAAARWELADAPRTVDDLAALVKLQRVLAVMTRVDGFTFGEALRFRVEMEARVTMPDVTCAIGLDNLYGTRVVTFISDHAPIATVPGGRYEIEVTVPPFGLLPGRNTPVRQLVLRRAIPRLSDSFRRRQSPAAGAERHPACRGGCRSRADRRAVGLAGVGAGVSSARVRSAWPAWLAPRAFWSRGARAHAVAGKKVQGGRGRSLR